MNASPWNFGWRLSAALLAAVLVTGGCGSTRSERELAGARAGAGSGEDVASLPAATVEATPAPGVQPMAPAASAGTSARAPVAAPPSATPGGKAPADPGVSPRDPRTAKAGAASTRGSAGTATTTPGAGGPAAPSAPVTGPKPEIVLGEIGTMSGIAGQGMAPVVHTARAWVADVNARGGLHGHRVRLVTGDDGGDPARALALARRMVDQDHVVAFYAHSMVLTLQAVLPFVEERKIPVIGGCPCNTAAPKSPMVFEVGTGSNVGTAFMFVMSLVAHSPERKVSLIYCREIAACAQGADNVRKRVAPTLGLELVHEAQASMAQPDFTAEVLAARNAGAAAIIVYLDNPSLLRLKRAAKRQGWSPLLTTGQPTFDERFLRDGGEDAEGVLIGSPMLSWESPKMADFVAAMSRYVPGGIKGGIGLTSWAAGKLIERVAGSFPDKAVTSADILRALYTVKNETLGGLILPVTFREGQPAPENLCAIMLRVEKGRFVAKDGDNYFCPHRGG